MSQIYIPLVQLTRILLPAFILFFLCLNRGQAQSFSQNNLNFNGKGSLSNGTSLTFGPDGRLYVTEYTGSIKIFTIERVGPGNYTVLSMEELKGIQSIQDYNDDGTLNSSQFRETIGMAVTGTASNPVIYVSSSDFRIGGGGGGGSGDVGLDTNSGIITRYSWNGSSWNEVDIVRGLPRSEENHATNGMEFTTINGINYLIVAQGGHTNAGGPSANFAYTTEYALSAAILSINLTMLEAMPILESNGRKYIYDLPTLDDPTRPNKNGITDPDAPGYDGIDINDPFGGNDGLNQALIVPGGPVQIFSPGYRNAYDLVVTKSGAVYVTDNGSNGGWGGFPVNEGGGSANNNYDPNEPGSTSSSGGEIVNNKDHLSLVTLDIQNYIFGSFYGGHPTPVRANPFGAGLYTNPAVTGTTGAIFRTQIYDPNGSRTGSTTDPSKGLPANWPPVKVANPVEGDYRGPGDSNPDGPVDALVTIWGTNTNGIAEYTASNFEGAMKGNLIAGVNTGELRRVELNTNGSLNKLTPSFASGIGGDALGVTCNSDNDIFPGTIWVATLNGKLVVMEPLDFVICVGPNDPKYDPNADNDSDGYTNKDEVDNGTDPCNGASQPSDFDKAAGAPLTSDLNDTDDDNDGILDSADPFQLGDPLKTGSDAFDLPVNNELFSSNPNLKGYMGLGMTGLMNNGAPNPNWLKWLDRRDNSNDPNPNDILGGAIGAMTMHMTAGTALGTSNNQEKGFQYGVKVSQATGKFTVAGGIMNFKAPLQLYGHPNTPNGELGFFIGDGTQSNYIKFVITKTGLIALQEINDVPSTPLKFSIPEASRPNSGATFFFNVDPSNGNISLNYSFDNGPMANLGTLTAQGAVLQAIQQSTKDLAVGFIGTSNAAGVELEGTWDYLRVSASGETNEPPLVLYRINSGGPEITAIDGKINWGPDTGINNSSYLSDAGNNGTFGFAMTGYSATVDQSTTPVSIFSTERFDGVAGSPNMTYSFPMSAPGNYLVRLYMGNGYDGTSSIGQRIFDVAIEGYIHPSMNDIDLSALFGHAKGGMIQQTVEVTDGVLNISFIHGVENPLVNGIEILGSNTSNIEVAHIPNQSNNEGEVLIGSLKVSATGGDGALKYTISGAPAGVVINSTTGVISGTLGSTSSSGSPYSVTVTVDDSDGVSTDAVSTQFTWAITKTGSLALWNDKNENENYTGRHECSFVQAGDKFYLMGGRESSKTIDVYNYNTNTWTSLTNSAPLEFNHYQATEYQGLIWVIGAFKTNNFPSELPAEHIWMFNPATKEWIQGSSIPSNRVRGSAGLTVYKDKFYISGGNTNGHDGGYVNWFDEYDPATGIWKPLANAPRARDHFHSAVIGDKLYLAGGRLSGGTGGTFKPVIKEVDVYNFTTQSWSTLPTNLPTPRAAASVAVFENKLLVIGGEVENENVYGVVTNDALKITEEFNPQLGSWSRIADLNYKRHGTQAIVSGKGVYVLAGSPNKGGGSQKNMEYLGTDAPAGTASVASIISAPSSVDLIGNTSKEIPLNLIDGNVGVFITSIKLEGTSSGKFNIVSGNLTNSLLKVNSNHIIVVKYIGSTSGETANLVINYGVAGQKIIALKAAIGNISVAPIPNQNNVNGDVLNNSLKVSATGGDGALKYAMSGAPAGVIINATTGAIGGTIAQDANLKSPYLVTVTVDDSDAVTTDAVQTNFTWMITTGQPATSTVLYRVNAGGTLISSIDANMDWSGDTSTQKSLFLTEAGQNSTYAGTISSYSAGVDQSSTPFNIFNTERYDGAYGPPNMTYSFPVSKAGKYEVRLYMGNGYSGTSSPGQRIFDVQIEGVVHPEFKNIDLSAKFGHNVGGVITKIIDVTDGSLNIIFLHGSIENPLINAIEILGGGTAQNTIQVTNIPNQSNYEGNVLTGSLKASATGGDGALVYKISGAPSGVVINSSTGVISGTIGSNTATGSPYTVTVTVDDSDAETTDAGSTQFTWTIQKQSTTQTPIQVTQIANQSNNEGVVLNGSLKATATGGDGALVYSISGAPSGVVINSSTGVISGTIGSNTASGSPYQVTVTVDDSDAVTSDAVKTQFSWTILGTTTQTPIQVTQIHNQSNFSGDVLNGSLVVKATGGDGALKYSIKNAPSGAVINAANGAISGTISQDAHLLSPYTVSVTVDDSDAFTNDAVTVNFSWKVDQVQVAYQGCTAEFWAGSNGSWCGTYKPTDSFFTVFGITNKRGLGGKNGVLSLKDALVSKGSGYNKLAKQAIAALLNACSSAVNYQYSETQVKAEVKDAFNNSAYSKSFVNTLSGKYESANNAGCPISTTAVIAQANKETEATFLEEELKVVEFPIIKLYPNPASAEVYLQAPDPSVQIMAVALDDYNGRDIKTFSRGQNLTYVGNERYSFNISNLPDGLYILTVSTKSSGEFNLRLIKKD